MAARDVTAAQGPAYPRVAVRRRRRGLAIGVDAGQVARRVAAGGLIGAMTLGSLALWTAVPAGGLWLASQFTTGAGRLSAISALIAIVGIPVAMAAGAKALTWLDLLYMRLTDRPIEAYVPAWRRSVSDTSSGPPSGVLDKIMVGSVIAATLAFAGWFLLFAGSSLPS